jgi:hypothetical protein
VDQFYISKQVGGPASWCKVCHNADEKKRRDNDPGYRERNRKRIAAARAADPEKRLRQTLIERCRNKYGITIEQYDELLATQEGHCALCESNSRLHIDHDHLSGRVRGILCWKCNTALGKLGDTAEAIERVAAYLGNNGA